MIEIRQAQPIEFSEILALRHEALDAHVLAQPALPDPADYAAETIQMVAVIAGRVVSTARLEEHVEYGPYVRRMTTSQDFRHQNIGKLLLAGIEIIADIRKIAVLTLHSRANTVRFYEKCGFIATGSYNEDSTGMYPMMKKEIYGKA